MKMINVNEGLGLTLTGWSLTVHHGDSHSNIVLTSEQAMGVASELAAGPADLCGTGENACGTENCCGQT